jgi:hypothetical protein
MASRRRGAARGAMAALSAALGAGVAVLVNIWTSGWPWAAGAGLAALVVCQGGLEWLRSSREHSAESGAGPAGPVVQRAGYMSGSELTGSRSSSPHGGIRQRLGIVKNSTVIGHDGGQSGKADGSAGPPAVRS